MKKRVLEIRELGFVFLIFLLIVNLNRVSAVCSLDLPSQIVALDGNASDFFGYSVAISGDVALVGAMLDDDKGANSGSAHVFRLNGSTWVQEQMLSGSDEVAYDLFGSSVAIDSDMAVVRAPRHYVNGFAGAVYVFRWNGSSWIEQQTLPGRDSMDNQGLTSSVSVSGNLIVIGAHQDSSRAYKAGAAYVYRYNGSSWVQEQKLTASDAAGADYFGFSVAASGDVIVIGADGDDDRGSVSGSAYVFGWNGSSWVQQQKLVPADGAANDLFGSSVAVSGGMAVVGAPSDDSSGLGFGSAYVFMFNGSTWVQETELYASDGATNDYFGASVAVSGDMVVVGAYQDDDKGGQSGSAYVFRWNGSTWIQETKLLDPNGASNDRFGYSVAASGDRAMAGAYWDDNINGADAGSAYIFNTTCSAPLVNYHPADTDNSFRINISEATKYGSYWKNGQTWPTPPNPIPISYATSAGSIWKNGEAYHYDSGFACPQCWIVGL